MEGKERKTFGGRYEKGFPESTTMIPSRSYFLLFGGLLCHVFQKRLFVYFALRYNPFAEGKGGVPWYSLK